MLRHYGPLSRQYRPAIEMACLQLLGSTTKIHRFRPSDRNYVGSLKFPTGQCTVDNGEGARCRPVRSSMAKADCLNEKLMGICSPTLRRKRYRCLMLVV